MDTYRDRAAVPAIQRTVTVAAPVDRAFDVFTSSFRTWWPADYHIGSAELADAVIEARSGGRWYERGTDGSECDWGRVLAWEPPHRLVGGTHHHDLPVALRLGRGGGAAVDAARDGVTRSHQFRRSADAPAQGAVN